MPRLVFERTGFVVDYPDGVSVAEACDRDIRAGVPFSCRHANCGICRLEVTEGMDLCEPRTEWEDELLTYLKERPSVRLGCQLRIAAGAGVVRLRVI
ncbi:MAG: (2Fe-2S)-binding protein [Myxococcaceae bacterium]|nr:MAG: (2Fe-2S)-binding protein [Myxococcaceae bacterium]